MQNFSPLSLKLREEIENDERMYCKNAKFLTNPLGTDFWQYRKLFTVTGTLNLTCPACRFTITLYLTSS